MSTATMTTSPPGPDPRYRPWRMRIFTATWLSYFGFYFCRKPFYAVKGQLGEVQGWDAATLSYLGTAYLLAYAIGQFVAGFSGDKLGPRRLLLIGMGATMLATACFGITNSLGWFTVLMFIQGLAQATGWSGNVGAIAPWFHRNERGTVLGWWGTCYQTGGVLGTMLAAYLLGMWGYQWAFFGGAIVMLGVWSYFLWAQRDTPEDVGLPPLNAPSEPGAPAQDDDDDGWSRDTMVSVALIGCFYFFVKFIRYALWSWAPFILDRNYGLQGSEAAFVSTIFDFAGIAGVIGLGMISDRYFSGRRVSASAISIAALLVSTGIMWLLGTSNLYVFVGCMGLIGFTLYGPDALMAGAGAIDVGSEKRAVLAAGIINGMGSVGSVTQELLLGRMLEGEAGLGPVFALLMGSATAALCFMGVLILRNRSGKSDL